MCHLWSKLVEIETCEYAAIRLGVKLSWALSLEDGTDIHPNTSVTNESTLTTTQKRGDLNNIASKVWNLAHLDPAAGHVLNTAEMLAMWSSTLVMELSPYTVGEENVSAGHVFACILCLHTPHLYNSVWLCDISLCHFIYTYLLTYSMEQSPSWEANWFCS